MRHCLYNTPLKGNEFVDARKPGDTNFLYSVFWIVEYISNLVADLIHEIDKQFITRTSKIKLIMRSTETVDKQIQSRATTTSRDSSNISISKKMNTYGAVAAAAADPWTSPMSMKRLAMSGKKSSLGKNSKPVVARVCFPKT